MKCVDLGKEFILKIHWSVNLCKVSVYNNVPTENDAGCLYAERDTHKNNI